MILRSLHIRSLQLRRSLQWRLVFIFILFTIALMLAIIAILNYFINSFYYETFKNGIEQGFQKWNISGNPNREDVISLGKDQNAMWLFQVSEFKSCTVIDKNTNEIVYTSDRRFSNDKQQQILEEVLKSRNYLSALAGRRGSADNLVHGKDEGQLFFDYARQAGDFVFYFRSDRTEWIDALNEINNILKLVFLIAIALALVFGFLISKAITVPIVDVMHKARKIAAGDFGQVLKVKSDDEIGKLTKAFNFMAKELKNTLNEVYSEKNKIETILNYMTDGVIAFNLKGEVIHANPATNRVLGVDKFDLDFNGFSKKYELGVAIEEILYLEVFNTKESEISTDAKIIKVYFALFTDEQKNAEGIIAVLHDATEQHKLDSMRKEFVANVSHELRTPITSIKSYSETLLDGAIDDKETTQRFLSVINTEADRMTRLVKDLLQLSRLDNRQMQWNIQQLPFEKLVRSCIEKIELSAKEKNQTLECFVIGEIPDIMADKDRIEQVVLNLLTNGIKYTPVEGKITIYIGKIYSEVYVKVIDSGIGIPGEDLSRIFERFYRTDKARSREMGGTGLGLAIAKEIVEAHKGSISVESEHGKGTEVTVKLPCVIES